MILRFGKLPNANRTYFLSRSQPPLHPDGIWRYYEATHDLDILLLSYPLLRREYTEYWNDGLHRTPTGLATNCDEGDPYLRPELASIAEAGHDFTPIFGPDIRRCTPLATNAQLVRYARVLGAMARTIGFKEDAERWTADAQERAAALRSVCWSDVDGYFFEYDWETGEQLPAWSLCAFWSLWADVASDAQAKRLVASIGRFEHDGLLTFTDRLYDNPFPELPTLQWSFPYSWPPLVTVVVEALWQHGFRAEATRVGANYLRHVLNVYEETGSLWEKYISADSGAEASIERYETAAFHGWTSASVAIIGRLIGLDTGPVASSR